MANFLLFLICPLLGHSQVINIEGKRFIKDTNGLVGKADFVFNINQNVRQVLVVGANVHTQLKHNKHRLLVITDLSFIKAGDQDFVNTGYQHLRYSYKLAKLLTWENFLQAQYNLALLLDRRYQAGSGPRLRLVKGRRLKLYTASLYLYEYQGQNGDSLRGYNHRLSSYISGNVDADVIDFSFTVFYQPNLANFEDYRFAADISFEVELSKHLNFKTGLNSLYDSRQPSGIPAHTYLMRNGITIKF